MKAAEKKPVRFLQIHLTEHCNLNCKGCTHFSPVAKESTIELSKLESTYQKLLPYLERWFCRLELLGGEPLLHPQIEDILLLTRKYYPSFEIRLITNGLLILHMPDSFFRICSENRIIICISAYPVNIDYAAIERRFEEFGVLFRYYGEYEDCKKFRQYKLNPKGIYERDISYQNCKYAGHCFQCRDDSIFPCFISAYAGHLNDYFGTAFQWEQGDYIDLDYPAADDDFQALATKSVPFCRYCNMEHPSEFPWEQSKKEISEWIETDR